MKKRVLSVLLCLVLVLALLPAPALASEENRTLYYWNGKMYSDATFTSEITGVSGWSGSGSTLTLSGLNFTTKAATALWLSAGTTVVLKAGTDNCVRSGKSDTNSCGIYAAGSVTVTGSGSLTAAGGPAKNSSYGVYAAAGVTIGGGVAVTAAGGTAADSYGVYAGHAVSVNAATVTVTGGEASYDSSGVYASKIAVSGSAAVTAAGGPAKNYSYGIDASSYETTNITIGDTSVVTAAGGTAGHSYGINASSHGNGEESTITSASITVSGSAAVTATGGSATSWSIGLRAYGYDSNAEITVSGSAAVTATGGSGDAKGTTDGHTVKSYGLYADADGDADISVSDSAAVTATGGSAYGSYVKSCGIYTETEEDANITVSGSAAVTATGGTAEADNDAESCGIYADADDDANITVSGSAAVTATGGTAKADHDAESCGIYADAGAGDDAVTVISGGLVIASGGQVSAGETSEAMNMTPQNGADSSAVVEPLARTSTFAVYGVGTTYKVITEEALDFRDTSSTPGQTPAAAPDEGSLDEDGYRWAAATKTLTLENIIVVPDGGNAVTLPAGATLTVQGTCVLRGADSEGESCGVYGTGNLTINGDGRLYAIGGTADNSYGLYAYGSGADAGIAVSGGAVTAVGGTADGSYSYGICAYSDGKASVAIRDSAVASIGGTAGKYSEGICVKGGNTEDAAVTIRGSAVTLIGGTAGQESYGIYTENYNGGAKILLENSVVTATGGTADGNGSCGLSTFSDIAASITVSASTVTATGGTSDGEESYGIFADGNREKSSSVGSISIGGVRGDSTVTAAGGTAALYAMTSLALKGKLVIPVGGTVKQYTDKDDEEWYTVVESDGAAPARTVCVKPAPSAPASPDSGSGGGSASVTVPASSGKGSVLLSASVSGGAASVSVTDAQLQTLLSDSGSTGTVTVDVSSLGANSAKLPASLTEAAASSSQGLRVVLPAGSVTLDAAALRNAGKGVLTVSVETVKPSQLTAKQQKLLGKNALIVDVNVLMNGVKISNLGGGVITVSVPYTPKAGEDVSKLVVWFLRDDGTLEPHAASYDAKTGTVTFTTTHLSRYVLGQFPFTDVPGDSYYYTAVVWAVNKAVTQGKSDTLFAPHIACTRAQTVTFLWRAMGSPEPTSTVCPFTDVKADAYYYKAVLWATEKGITQGTSGTTFSPEDTCTRAQVVTFQWRAAGSPVVNFAMRFTDVSEDLYYAEAVRWAVSETITGGTTAATFSPAKSCTRAQIVTFLWRQLGR